MKLIALNKEWAVYSTEDKNEDIDSFAALNDLLSVKTYSQFIDFLIAHTCNTVFASDSDTDFDDAYNRPHKNWRNKGREISLQGNFDNAIELHPEIDFLDELVIRDLEGQEIYQLYLPELIDFAKTFRRFLMYAAVALGADAYEAMFKELDPSLIFDEEWVHDNLGCKPSDITSFYFPEQYIGAGHDCYIPDYAFDGGIFDHLQKYSRYQQIIDNSKEYGGYTDGFPFSIDGVIYSYEEIYFGDEPSDYRDAMGEVCLTVSFLDDIEPAYAKKLLAGRAVEAILNTGFDMLEQRQFNIPSHPDVDFDNYGFIPDKGFIEKEPPIPPWWVEVLSEEAKRLVVEGKVSLCPVCGKPVLIRDYRGRKAKLVCSDSCKTKASSQRRDLAYQYAASGIPIEEAIERIGEEYEKSIRKWYKESMSLTAR